MNLTNKNYINITGKLIDCALEVRAGKNPDKGQMIIGDFTIDANGNEIKINGFSYQYKDSAAKNQGTESNLYSSLIKMKSNVGSRFTISASISPNAFVGRDGNYVETQRIRCFSIKAADRQDEATFNVSGFLHKLPVERINKEGGLVTYDFVLGQMDYQNTKAELIKLNIEPNHMEYYTVLSSLSLGTSIEFSGTLDHTITETRVETPSIFGAPEVKVYQNKQSFYNIQTARLVEDETSYTPEDIDRLVKGTEEEKNKVIMNAGNKPAATTSTAPKLGVDFL